MKIGTIDLGDKPLFLAPMEDVTDPSFRHVCKSFGADMVYTEFISSDGLIRDARTSIQKLEILKRKDLSVFSYTGILLPPWLKPPVLQRLPDRI